MRREREMKSTREREREKEREREGEQEKEKRRERNEEREREMKRERRGAKDGRTKNTSVCSRPPLFIHIFIYFMAKKLNLSLWGIGGGGQRRDMGRKSGRGRKHAVYIFAKFGRLFPEASLVLEQLPKVHSALTGGLTGARGLANLFAMFRC